MFGKLFEEEFVAEDTLNGLYEQRFELIGLVSGLAGGWLV